MKMRIIAAVAYCAAAMVLDLSSALADDFNQLGDAIKKRFGAAGYLDGQLGQDWCFNVETEPGYTYWYYAIGEKGTPPKGTKIQHTARIQAIYKEGGMFKYASVFLGLDLPKNAPAPYSTSFFSLNSNAQKFLGAGTELKEPGGDSKCMSFGQFLSVYVYPYGFLKAADVSKPERDEDSEVYTTGARYWTFAGRPHSVVAIATFDVTLTYVDAIKGTQEQSAKLVVGFGGGAGP